jgi:DNA repair protein RadC
MSSTEGVHMIREVAIRYVGARRRLAEKTARPAEAARCFRRRIHDDAREHFVAPYLDGRHRAIADAIVSIGTATASLVHPREVFRLANGPGACAASGQSRGPWPQGGRRTRTTRRRQKWQRRGFDSAGS